MFTKHSSRNTQVSKFFKKIKIFGFSWYRTREDLSIHVSFTSVWLHDINEAKVISALSTSENSISTFFEKIEFLGSHAEVFVKTSPLVYQILM